MKLITKRNFLSIACIGFTLTVCGKLILEKAMGFTDKNYTENILACLVFSVLITSVLALHYHLQSLPLIPVLIGQYAVLIGLVVGFVKLADAALGTTTEAMWKMILSVTVPYIAGAAVYYISFFRQIKKANSIISVLGVKEGSDA